MRAAARTEHDGDEPDSSSRTVPARGHGWPVTGDKEGEGREVGSVPSRPLQRRCSELGPYSACPTEPFGPAGQASRGMQGSIRPARAGCGNDCRRPAHFSCRGYYRSTRVLAQLRCVGTVRFSLPP